MNDAKMDFKKIARNIKKAENGIYYSESKKSISYPEDGNEQYLQIEEDSFWFNHRNDILAESIKKYNSGKVFFDIGGGNGYVSKRLQDEGIKTVLVEPGKAGALNASKRGLNNVICSTLDDAEFTSNSIDSVGLFDVVEHIENDRSFLNNVSKYMKEDGLVYITVPAYNFLWSNEDNDAGHFRRYSKNQLASLLQKSGFKIIYSTYIFSLLPIPIFISRSLPSKLGFNKNSDSLEKHQDEHKLKKGVLNNLVQRIWKWELSRVKKNLSIPFGSSCFIIGRKVSNIV